MNVAFIAELLYWIEVSCTGVPNKVASELWRFGITLSYLIACTLLVKLWRARLMKTASMSLLLTCCWYSMSTWGMIWWNSCRKNWKSSSCSILRKPDASLTVVLSNEPDILMDSKHCIRSSRFSYTVLTILLLKFHRVDEALGSLRSTIWSSFLVRFGDNTAQVGKENSHWWDVRSGLLHD